MCSPFFIISLTATQTLILKKTDRGTKSNFSPGKERNADAMRNEFAEVPVSDVGVVNRSEPGPSRIISTHGEYTCHVVSCVIYRGGDVGTATGHNCNPCKVPFHSVFCQKVLNLLVHESSDPYIAVAVTKTCSK